MLIYKIYKVIRDLWWTDWEPRHQQIEQNQNITLVSTRPTHLIHKHIHSCTPTPTHAHGNLAIPIFKLFIHRQYGFRP